MNLSLIQLALPRKNLCFCYLVSVLNDIYIYLLDYLFICFRRNKVTSFAMEKTVYMHMADDLMQDGILSIKKGTVFLGQT